MTDVAETRPTTLITGGSRGIGAATAALAADRGYLVAIAFKSNVDAAQRVVGEIEQRGGAAFAVQADVGSEADVRRLFAEVERRAGRLDALVNNAAILERLARVESIDAARLQRVFATNVVGAFLCAREAVHRMSTRHGGDGGAIVNVSSGAARTGSPNEYVDYAASKAALDALTIGLAKEVAADGIRVNGIRPGFIYTELHASGGEPNRVDRLAPLIPMKRGGRSAEIAAGILWLLSDEASYVTGAIVDASGGA
jgi:NAD(P)-dependent dehydrogenase (short-subunit alcohol dehydrogenase family)